MNWRLTLKILILISIPMVIWSCTSIVQTQKSIQIDEYHSELKFNPEKIVSEISSGLEMELRPIDAKSLNEITYYYNLFDGNYEIESSNAQVLIERKLREERLSVQEKIRLKKQLQIFEYLKKQVQLGELPEDASKEIMWKIWDKGKGGDGIEYSRKYEFPNNYNPFFIDGKYLSVFDVILRNQTSGVKRIASSQIIISSGMEQLYPLESKYYEDAFPEDQGRLDNIQRLNFPEELVIPPNGVVRKYFATQALSPTNKNLTASVIQGDSASSFKYSVSFIQDHAQKTLDMFTFAGEKFSFESGRFYFVLKINGEFYTLRENKVFISQESQDVMCSIYGIAGIEEGFIFGKLENFQFSDFNDSKVVNIDLMKRENY